MTEKLRQSGVRPFLFFIISLLEVCSFVAMMGEFLDCSNRTCYKFGREIFRPSTLFSLSMSWLWQVERFEEVSQKKISYLFQPFSARGTIEIWGDEIMTLSGFLHHHG